MDFLTTKEYLKFTEFANACAKYRYIGLCYGTAGVGKTMSAHQYSAYHLVHQYDRMNILEKGILDRLQDCKAVFHTVEITNTPKRIKTVLYNKMQLLGTAKLQAQGKSDITEIALNAIQACPLVIVDEADRLTMKTLEQLRDLYDNYGFGLILIGMPGIEKRLMRYAQFYSRIGFAHEFRALGKQDVVSVINQFCQSFEVELSPNPYQKQEAIKTIIVVTRGNFRLTQRLFNQMKRIKEINKLQYIDKEIIEAARNLLVIGYE